MRKHKLALALAVLSACAFSSASAQNYYWDPDGGTANAQYGDGIWNTSNTNWSTAEEAGSNLSWANDSGSRAIFNAGSEVPSQPTTTLTLGESIVANRLDMSSEPVW